ncbi:MAG: GDSL-type esterase/lipase family protein [Pirellulaceae bacterium]
MMRYCLLFLAIAVNDFATAQQTEDRWEKEIQKFERQDQERPPVLGGDLFIGSSSVRLWDLSKSFPDRSTVNRGFGGSQIADSTKYVQRIVVPHRPSQIVMYAGDNDIAHGKDPDQVVADFQQFVNTVFGVLPETKIAFIAIKPSIKRWELWPQMKAANQGIEAICQSDPRLIFIDISQDMLEGDAKPSADLFAKDGLHLSDKGYALWNARVEATLGW